MESLLRELTIRKRQLDEVISSTEEILRQAPAGRVRVERRNGSTRYFQVLEAYSHGKYIHKENRDLAVKLAEKDYLSHILESAKKERSLLEKYLGFMKTRPADHLYRTLSEGRKMLVSPVLLDGGTYADMWLAKTYAGNPQYPERLTFRTRRGELVRSKTEVFIANVYFELGIPYKYECPVVLRNGKTRYPDFTLLDIAHHRVVYHEHLGMLEDPDYRKAALIKLQEYGENGIFTGKNLILTSETSYAPFDPERFRNNVWDAFQVEFLRKVIKGGES